MLEQTILTLVRHGQTLANIDGVWHGSTDTELTPTGQLQAEQVADFLADHGRNATAVYASPLQRAQRTAAAIAERLGLEVRTENDLREYAIGQWEGKTFSELQETHQLWEQIARDPDFAPHGGDSPRQVVDRLTSCLRRIAKRHPRERIIAVAHGGALSLGLAELLPKLDRWKLMMKNCAVSELVLEPEPELLSFNLVDHLDAA